MRASPIIASIALFITLDERKKNQLKIKEKERKYTYIFYCFRKEEYEKSEQRYIIFKWCYQ